MQIKSLRIKSYRSWKVNDTASLIRDNAFEAVGVIREVTRGRLFATDLSGGYRLVKGDLLSLAEALSSVWFGGIGEWQSCAPTAACLWMDETTGTAGIAPAQTFSIMGQAQAVAGPGARSGVGVKREHGGAHRDPAGTVGPG